MVHVVVQRIIRPGGRAVVIELVLPGSGGKPYRFHPWRSSHVIHRSRRIVPSVEFSRDRDASRKTRNIIAEGDVDAIGRGADVHSKEDEPEESTRRHHGRW